MMNQLRIHTIYTHKHSENVEGIPTSNGLELDQVLNQNPSPPNLDLTKNQPPRVNTHETQTPITRRRWIYMVDSQGF